MTEVHVRIAKLNVSCLPEGHVDARHFTCTVEWRGGDRWAVCRMGECLGSDGEWDYEPLSSSREDDWLATHRFDYDTALRLATEAAPKLTVNGWTVAEVLAKGEKK